MLNKFFLLLIIGLVLFSCKNDKPNKEIEATKDTVSSIEHIDWIIGTWIDSTSFKPIGQTYVEVWEKKDENDYVGFKHAVIRGESGDTTKLKIYKSEGKYFLSVEKKEGRSTFLHTNNRESAITFSNTKDEFPYDINYRRQNNNLIILVSGKLNGSFKSIKYNTLKDM